MGDPVDLKARKLKALGGSGGAEKVLSLVWSAHGLVRCKARRAVARANE